MAGPPGTAELRFGVLLLHFCRFSPLIPFNVRQPNYRFVFLGGQGRPTVVADRPAQVLVVLSHTYLQKLMDHFLASAHRHSPIHRSINKHRSLFCQKAQFASCCWPNSIEIQDETYSILRSLQKHFQSSLAKPVGLQLAHAPPPSAEALIHHRAVHLRLHPDEHSDWQTGLCLGPRWFYLLSPDLRCSLSVNY